MRRDMLSAGNGQGEASGVVLNFGWFASETLRTARQERIATVKV